MEAICDRYIVDIEVDVKSTIDVGGTKIYRPVNINQNQYLTTKGVVVSAPKLFSAKPENWLHEINEAYPPKVIYRDGRWVKQKGDGLFSFADVDAPDILPGDIIYFDPMAIITDIKDDTTIDIHPNYLGMFDGKMRYIMNPSSIYCYVRGGEMKAFPDRVICEITKDIPEAKEVINGIEVEGNMVGDLFVPCTAKQNHETAIIKWHGHGFGEMHKDLSEGDEVFFIRENDLERDIDGQLYYVMSHSSIIAKIRDGKLIPVGDWLSMRMDQPKKYTGPLLGIEYEEELKDWGTVLSVGEKVKALSPDMRAIPFRDFVYGTRYNSRLGDFERHSKRRTMSSNVHKFGDVLFMREGDVMIHG